MIATLILAIGASVGIGVYIGLKLSQNQNKSTSNLSLPPGPWGFPIFGHLPFLRKHPGIKFMEWAKIYGPIFSIKFGGIPTVVLNDAKIIKEAFQMESFNGRPKIPNFILPSGLKGTTFTDGPRQTEQRKFMVQALKTDGLTKTDLEYRAEEEIEIFVKSLKSKFQLSHDDKNGSKRSNKFTVDHFFQYPLINAIWVSVMGWRFTEDDPTLNHLAELLDKTAETNRSVVAQMSWFLPWVANALSFFHKNFAVNSLQTAYSYVGEQIEKSREDYVEGQPKSIQHAYFDEVARTKDTSSSFYKGNENRFTIGDVFMGAADSTTLALDWLLFHLAKEPYAQEKLQKEIDEVLGLGTNGECRPPTLADRPKMPYTEAVIQELLRICALAPLGIFRRTMEDVVLHGYRIPKDTMIVPNIYGVHRDPAVWSEPDSFRPERFLNGGEGNSKAGNLILPFSSGRRTCVAEGYARDLLFLISTHFFQKFTIALTEKKPATQPRFGILLKPVPFEVLITERN